MCLPYNYLRKTTNNNNKIFLNLTIIFVFHLCEAISKVFIVYAGLLKASLQYLYSVVFCGRFGEHDQTETKQSFGEHFEDFFFLYSLSEELEILING